MPLSIQVAPLGTTLSSFFSQKLVAIAALLLLASVGVEQASAAVTANPTPNAGPAKNPLKGFNSGWWNPNQDFASLGYQTLEWGRFEPTQDNFDWDYVEGVLGRDGSRGRHLIVQLFVDWNGNQPVADNYKGPQWLVGDGPGELDVNIIQGHEYNDPTRPIVQATDYNDPKFISEAAEAVAALTNYLRDDPRTFVIQTGMLGWWAEWHTFNLPQATPGLVAKQTILESYLNGIGPGGFLGTNPGGLNGTGQSGIGIGPSGLTQVRYPDEPVNVPQARMGYVNGSVIPSNHGYEFGVEIGANELWRNGPVGGETPPLDGVSVAEVERFFETEEGAYFLRQGGYTHMFPPEDHRLAEKLGSWTRNEHFEAMHRLMGYNFQVEEVRHVDTRTATGAIQLEVDLLNAGIAPFYKDWDVELAVLDASGVVVDLEEINFDLRTLMPGDSTTFTATLGGALDPGADYRLALRIVQPGADDPKTVELRDKWRKLDPTNVYAVLANDVAVVNGTWDANTVLQGGWNILNTTGNAISSAVPEPSACLLVLSGVLAFASRRGSGS